MVPQGIANVARLAAVIDNQESQQPELVWEMSRLPLEQIRELGEQTGKLDAEVRKRAKKSDEAKRLTAIPGIGLRRDFSALSPTVLDRGKAEARQDLADGAARPQAAARRRSGCGRPMGVAARNERSLAGRAGEQDGADGLGRLDEEGVVPGSRCRPGDGRSHENG